MSMNRPMKRSLTVSIIIFLFLGFITPSTITAIKIDLKDGIWTDSFDDKYTTAFINRTSSCILQDNTIILTQTTSGGRPYDFFDGGSYKNNAHKAYYYQSIFPIDSILSFLFSPSRHTDSKETQFAKDDFYYGRIEKPNETVIAERYAQSSAMGRNKYAVHHFRFKLDGTAETIGDLDIYWDGKGENTKKIELFYWRYATLSLFGKWTLLADSDSSGDLILRDNLSSSKLKNALNSDNYIDICVVATKDSSECTLFTDYIKLIATQQTGYKIGYGNVQTKNTINLTDSTDYWDLLTWDDYESGTATVNYQILYSNAAGVYVPIKNSILAGNEQGFTIPPISLISLSNTYPKIKIQGNLTTKDPSVTPKIYSWTLTWQKKNQWQDHFNSSYRISVKDSVVVDNDSVNISLVSGGWPMFGQNAENTRASNGPAATSDALYWISYYHENQTLGNPVIDGDSLYIYGRNKYTGEGSLYKYKNIIVSSDKIGKRFTGSIIEVLKLPDDLPIVGSPAISDQFIVVATGKENSKNSVYIFDKNSLSSKPKIYNYSDNNLVNPEICYWGSPVIADGLIFLSTWGGDASLSGYHNNNKLLAIDPVTAKQEWNRSFSNSSNPIMSKTWSFCTPAVSNHIIVVGCMNDRGNNLFAFEAQNGSPLWNISVDGAIGKSSPVIYNNTVYIVSEEKEFGGIRKKTKVTAVNLDDGSIRWTVPLGRTLFTPILNSTYCLAQTTPAIANGILYVTSPGGLVFAIDIQGNGTILWCKEVYSKFTPPYLDLTSSPAYADGIVYVGTPDGFLCALNTAIKGNYSWHRKVLPYDKNISVVTDPIISNGIVFFGAENGILYARGIYVPPNQEISGNITSVPITLPTGYWWKKFYAQAQTDGSSTINKITFSILDENGNFLKKVGNKSDILLSNQIIGRTMRLHADFWAKNSSVNPKLFFWNVTFAPDQTLPYIYRGTLTPNPSGYLNGVVQVFTVKTKDNDTGLLVSSARYTLEYKDLENQTKHATYHAFCTGVNGTTNVEQITVNISKLDFFSNISTLKKLWINISDLAGNTGSLYVQIKQDKSPPVSYVLNKSMRPRYNGKTSSIRINITSFDNGTDASGIKRVDLYYRYSSTGNFSKSEWVYYANSTRKSPSFQFNLTNKPNRYGGYYQLCSVATDNASNIENLSDRGDVSFLYDWKVPDLPEYSGDTLWSKERLTYAVKFKDDFRLDTIQYRPNFETIWTTIATDVNASTYNQPWSLKEEYWDQMNEGEVYYLYFKINDTLGNTLNVTSNNQAITFRKDTAKPNGTIDFPSLETEISLSYNFTVSGLVTDQDGSGVKEVSLHYRFSKDNSSWSNWTVYGDTLRSFPFKWEFTAAEGDGYYEFIINVTDNAGNKVESKVSPIEVFPLPITLILVMIGLVVVLSLISTVIFIKWRKRK